MRIRKLVLSGAAFVAAVGVPATAMAEDYVKPVNEDAKVEGNNLSRGTDPTTKVLGTTTGRSSGLPVTGGDIAGLTAIGLAAVGTGTVLVRRSRRTNTTTTTA